MSACDVCGVGCQKASRPNEYLVHGCGQRGRSWCAHLGTHLPNFGLHSKPAPVHEQRGEQEQ